MNTIERVNDALDAGHNIFLTGSAGTGKTYSILEYRENSNRCVALAATTGIAAMHLGGETIHRLSGIGIETDLAAANRIINKIEAYEHSDKWWLRERWELMQRLEAIVIDEVSMLRRDQFDLINRVFQGVRRSDAPFGGIQMALVGDFLQLPPVITDDDYNCDPRLQEPYCFQSPTWRDTDIQCFELTEHHRQHDPLFLRALECIRAGIITADIDELMRSRINADLKLEIAPLKLFPLRRSVYGENMRRLMSLPGNMKEFQADYAGKDWEIESLKQESHADDVLILKEGAQVMCIVNDRAGEYVNGSMGIVKRISSHAIQVQLAAGPLVDIGRYTWMKKRYRLAGSNIITEGSASVTQFPLKLAYASTIHKSQGMSLDAVEMDISNCFATGQAYVALSRVRTLEGLRLIGWNPASVKVDNRVLEFYRRMYESN